MIYVKTFSRLQRVFTLCEKKEARLLTKMQAMIMKLDPFPIKNIISQFIFREDKLNSCLKAFFLYDMVFDKYVSK